MINGMPILVHRDHDETIQGDCLSIHFYLNFTLRKREKKKKRPFEVEQCVQPIRNNSEFCACATRAKENNSASIASFWRVTVVPVYTSHLLSWHDFGCGISILGCCTRRLKLSEHCLLGRFLREKYIGCFIITGKVGQFNSEISLNFMFLSAIYKQSSFNFAGIL